VFAIVGGNWEFGVATVGGNWGIHTMAVFVGGSRSHCYKSSEAHRHGLVCILRVGVKIVEMGFFMVPL
jgi:hypothetical protein